MLAQDVIASHFTIRKQNIRRTCVPLLTILVGWNGLTDSILSIEGWAKTQPLMRNYTVNTASRTDQYIPHAPPPYYANKQASAGMDLLVQFDLGIELVESWSKPPEDD